MIHSRILVSGPSGHSTTQRVQPYKTGPAGCQQSGSLGRVRRSKLLLYGRRRKRRCHPLALLQPLHATSKAPPANRTLRARLRPARPTIVYHARIHTSTRTPKQINSHISSSTTRSSRTRGRLVAFNDPEAPSPRTAHCWRAMGNISSRPDEGSPLCLTDQKRCTIPLLAQHHRDRAR